MICDLCEHEITGQPMCCGCGVVTCSSDWEEHAEECVIAAEEGPEA